MKYSLTKNKQELIDKAKELKDCKIAEERINLIK